MGSLFPDTDVYMHILTTTLTLDLGRLRNPPNQKKRTGQRKDSEHQENRYANPTLDPGEPEKPDILCRCIGPTPTRKRHLLSVARRRKRTKCADRRQNHMGQHQFERQRQHHQSDETARTSSHDNLLPLSRLDVPAWQLEKLWSIQ